MTALLPTTTTTTLWPMNQTITYPNTTYVTSVVYDDGGFPVKWNTPGNGALNMTSTTVLTKAGHRGQVHYAGKILWESRPYKSKEKAKAAADARIQRGLEFLLK